MDMVGSPSPSPFPSLTILLPHCVLLAVAVWHLLQQISFRPYNTAAPTLLPHGGKLTVHLVSHSHLDIGWLKAVDQYFLGCNNSIQVLIWLPRACQHLWSYLHDPLLEDYNVPERMDLFVDYAHTQSNELLTNHIMWPMGDDFAYYVDTWFKQIDKLIHYVNKDGRVNALYSIHILGCCSCRRCNMASQTDDYFPYSDCPHCFWTGYFTSRPALKGYVRKLSGFLQVEESEKLSKMATVNLSKIFPNKKIVEVSLSANQEKSALRKLKWRIEGDQDSQRIFRGGPLRKDDPNIDIAPMEIITNLNCIQEGIITLFRFITMFCGTNNIPWNIPHI